METPIEQSARQAYNKFLKLPTFSMNCINRLLEEDELVWKLLKYNSPDAWERTNLTMAQKRELIYAGQEDTTFYRVFMDNGTPDVWTREDCILRISPYAIVPENRTVATVSMNFEIYSHYKINTLSNYQTRVDTITARILEIFNGADIDGLGRLFFDRMGSYDARAYQASQIPFKGKNILMATKAA